jgi:CubicO group peptidase (beta-lactamase class C family)
MADFIDSSVAGASIAVIENGRVFFQGAYGYADIDMGIMVNTDTVFEWGSVGKLLVWVSAMQLAEQGRLNLEADIQEYLPEGFLEDCNLIHLLRCIIL